MAQIEKRAQLDGTITYRARVRLLGMPDISASFSTRTQAREWARKKEGELRTARYFPRDDGKNRTFAEFVDLYIDRYLSKKILNRIPNRNSSCSFGRLPLESIF